MSDEFEEIRSLFRPLSEGAPGAFGLTDDAAAIPSRPGFDLVVTKDALVAGVHFLPDDPPDLVARKLLRVNLSDLAAKGAEPYGYFLSVHWPRGFGAEARRAFAAGLAQDQAAFGLHLLGGDTVATPGPLTVTATMMGWVPSGTMVRRAGAKAGQRLLTTGTIGDGGLGLAVVRGEATGLDEAAAAALAARYRLPQPRVALGPALRRFAAAAADVSDGLLADAGHIAEASGVGLAIDLDRLPLSPAARAWLALQPDRAEALAALASAGDDYELVLTAEPGDVAGLAAAASELGVGLTEVGEATAQPGLALSCAGRAVEARRTGWRHF